MAGNVSVLEDANEKSLKAAKDFAPKEEKPKAEGETKAQSKLAFPSVLLLVAMASEREKIVKPALKKLGLLGREDIWVITTGIGKVNATLSTAMVLTAVNSINPQKFPTCLCVNVGVCGGNEIAAREFPAVQINQVVNNDFDTGVVTEGFKKQVIDITTEVVGMKTCLTQDHFCVDTSELPNDGKPYYVDMELFGIASACGQFGVRCSALKSVVDQVGSEAQPSEYKERFDAACERAAELLIEYLSTCTDVVLTD